METLKKEDIQGRYNDFKAAVRAVTDMIQNLLSYKNTQYDDSFARLREEFPDYLLMRLTDKLNRLKVQKRKNLDYCDTLIDIAGYCVLELAHIAMEDKDEATVRDKS